MTTSYMVQSGTDLYTPTYGTNTITGLTITETRGISLEFWFTG